MTPSEETELYFSKGARAQQHLIKDDARDSSPLLPRRRQQDHHHHPQQQHHVESPPQQGYPPPPPSQQQGSSKVKLETGGTKFDIELRDWIGHRVLARRDAYFCPGLIHNVYEGYSVSILFDGEEQPLIYHEVLSGNEIDTIISDAVPDTNQVRPTSEYRNYWEKC